MLSVSETTRRTIAERFLLAANKVLQGYARKLDEAGVTVTCVRYNGMIHEFGLLNGLATLPQTRSLFIQAAAELKKYLKPA